MISFEFLSLLAGAVLCLVAGAALGLRFKFYMLMPALFLALIAVVGTGFASGVDPWWIVLDAVVVWFALQVGYIAGAMIQTRTVTSPRHYPTQTLAMRRRVRLER